MTRKQFREFRENFFREANNLAELKNADYATGGDEDADAFANFRLCEMMKATSTEIGVFVRLTDKISRLGKLLQSGYSAQVKDESIRDTCKDISNYSAILCGIVSERFEE